MKMSMYQASAPRFTNMLNNLSTILDKASAHAEANKIDAAALTAFRLYPNMLPLTRQVQIACDSAKGAVARLSGTEAPKHEDTEQGFDELKARIEKTVAFIAGVPASRLDGTEDKEVVLKIGGMELKFNGLQYLLGFALPNFYFHVTTAYNILRHNGVVLAKRDYIGTP